MEYRADILIDADPGRIWRILADAPSWPDWESGVKSVEGRVAPGERLKVVSELNPGRAYPVKVTELEPNRRMTWQGGMPLGLFKGVRTFDLRPEADGETRFTVEERFSGPLRPLIGRSIPDMGPSLAQFARGLKQKAEAAG
jgi:hypothetical protein